MASEPFAHDGLSQVNADGARTARNGFKQFADPCMQASALLFFGPKDDTCRGNRSVPHVETRGSPIRTIDAKGSEQCRPRPTADARGHPSEPETDKEKSTRPRAMGNFSIAVLSMVGLPSLPANLLGTCLRTATSRASAKIGSAGRG